MRITRESLHTIARETAEKSARRNRDLVCIYLTGSLLSDDPLLGGTADIDLIYVHASTPPYPREVIRVTDEIHLDNAHYPQSYFKQPRHLRQDPWVGSFLSSHALQLYDTNHWFEFTQASAGAQFDQPENVVVRARQLESAARQSWFELQTNPGGSHADNLNRYLSSLENAANSISLLTGVPLTERRFIQQFPQRAAALGRPGLYGGLVDLFFSGGITGQDVSRWLEPWKECLQTASLMEDVPPRLAQPRFAYYERAAAALNEDDPAAALWLVLRTWARAILVLPAGGKHSHSWQESLQAFELGSDHLSNRLSLLDSYLDAVEDTLDSWARQHGV